MAVYHRTYIPACAAAPSEVRQAVGLDSTKGKKDVSFTLKNLDEVQNIIKTVSKQTVPCVCSKCSYNVCKVNLRRFVCTECQQKKAAKEREIQKLRREGRLINIERIGLRKDTHLEKQKELQQSTGEKAQMQTDLEKQMTVFRKHYSTLSSTNSVLQRQITSKDDEILSLKSDNDRLKTKMHSLEEEKETSQKDMKNLESVHDELKSENKEMHDTIDALELELKALKNDNENMTRDMKTLEENNKQLKMHLSAMEGVKRKMQTDLEQQMAIFRNLNTTFSSTNSFLQRQISLKDDEVLSLRSDNDRLKTKVHTLKEVKETSQKIMKNLNSQNEEHKSKSRELHNTIDSQKEELNSLKSCMDNMTKDGELLVEENEQLRNSLSVVERKKARMQSDLEQQRTELRNFNTTLSSTNSVLQRQINSKDVEIGSLKTGKENMTRSMETLAGKNDQLKMHVCALEREMERMQNDLEKQLTAFRKDNTKLSSTNSVLQGNIRTKDENIQFQATKIKNLENELEILQEQNEQTSTKTTTL